MLLPRDNPDIVSACEKQGISESELRDVCDKLKEIFDACYNDVFPSDENVEPTPHAAV